ncbi:MAG TPA: alpha/beta hydrolase-fold protein [Allosphingosinicella sp.]|nr:alpha/beta hydrolase-fold protein [Allosphingosinicella sp.]
MRLLLLFAAFISPITLAEAAAAQAKPPDNSVTIEGTDWFDMTGRNGTQYRIMVYFPEGDAPAGGWPILYVLDGDAYFPVAATMAGNLAGSGESGIGDGVVVAIGYTDEVHRDVDYTLRTPPRPENADAYLYPTIQTGGADAFLDFIQNELKPRIEGRWRIDRARQALVGHGYGGLFVLHSYFTRPDSFSTYIASSPSIWFMGRAILAEERAFLARAPRPEGRRLVITAAEFAQSLPPAMAVAPDADARLQDNGRRRMVDNAREMAWRLQNAGLPVEWRFFPGETQGSVAYPALGHAIALAFALRPAAASQPTAASQPAAR